MTTTIARRLLGLDGAGSGAEGGPPPFKDRTGQGAP